jgi:Glycoside-hydrolase family GH114
MTRISAGLGAVVGIAVLAAVAVGVAPAASAATVRPLPANATFDYQIGGDYPPVTGVRVVSRDWFSGRPLAGPGTYSVCYVNAFQTQDDEAGVNRRDERSNWPRDLVLTALGDDPDWGGEYLVDLSTAARRQRAAQWVKPMVDTCAAKGFAAVEYDNLDSWTRFDGTPRQGAVPFGRAQAVAYAELLTDYAHSKNLAVGQKNTPQLGRVTSLQVVGFDFAVAEQCGQYDECGAYTAVFGNRVVDVEYTDAGYARACRSVGAQVTVVRRDVGVSPRGSGRYRFGAC